MSLYLKNGYIDFNWIEKVADKNNISFIVCIGKRQVGKTYGCLELMLNAHKNFILLRRTNKELSMIKNKVNSPFEKIKGYTDKIEITGGDDAINEILLNEGEDIDNKKIGIALALTTVASVRGFSASQYTDVVYDEAIPETHVYKIKHEEDAFLNAYVTINSNRELEEPPKKAVRCWILSNSNNLDAAILRALNITEIVERMSLHKEEIRILKDRGIMIILPDSKTVTEKHKKTALYKAVGTNSNFAKMALENEFSYNDFSDVKQVDIINYKPLVRIGIVTVFKHKSKSELYICESGKETVKYKYSNTEYYINLFNKDFPNIRPMYIRGKVFFQSVAVKSYFLNIILK